MSRRLGFHRHKNGSVDLTLDASDAELLGQLLDQLVALLQPEGADAAPSDDPLAALVGIGTATEAPEDPALARLLPDAYRDDTDRAAEFRRYTELSLREAKQQRALVARRTLDDPDRGALTDDELDAWMRSLNDVRLVVGARLGVTDDAEADWQQWMQLAQDDPRLMLVEVYDWTTQLLATLLHALGD